MRKIFLVLTRLMAQVPSNVTCTLQKLKCAQCPDINWGISILLKQFWLRCLAVIKVHMLHECENIGCIIIHCSQLRKDDYQISKVILFKCNISWTYLAKCIYLPLGKLQVYHLRFSHNAPKLVFLTSVSFLTLINYWT